MRLKSRCIYFLFLIIPANVVSKKEKKQAESCAVLYEKGVQAYLENRFKDCVENLENALQIRRSYDQALQNCRLICHEEAQQAEPLYPVDVENLLFYEKSLRNTLCLIKCRNANQQLASDSCNIDYQTQTLFEERKPYEYLHLCFSQTKQPQKAASAAFTFLVSHPKDEAMIKNLKYYSTLAEVDMKEIVNFEAKNYVYLYIHGADAYEKKDWKGVEANMEESLISYLHAEEECRAQCEGPFHHDIYPDFIPSIANHFTYTLKCKRTCSEKLNNLNGEHHSDLLPSHYHYLQFAYFKNGNLKEACKAAASYVLFYPDDEVMRGNLDYYRKLPKVQESYFSPRDEAVSYVRRSKYESRLLKFIEMEYNFSNGTTSIVIKKSEQARAKKYPQIELVLDADELNGTNRFVSDGLATQDDCKGLLQIAKLFAEPGDGYKGKKSPHTDLELFEGLMIGKAALLVHFGLMDPQSLALFLKVTENARRHLVERFRLTKKLYFNFTHLVCRSALPNSPENRTDFSHEIHADNCHLISNSWCEKSRPAFTWRDYSAIVYLNQNFKGGEFVFAQDKTGKIIQSSVQPKCGRMVGFSSGVENLHGVKAVKKGSRCAIALWFTFNEKYAEIQRDIALQLIQEEVRN